MRSERIELRSESGIVYKIKREYEGDRVSFEEFLRDDKILDYAVYLSVADSDAACGQYKSLRDSGRIQSEKDLAKLVKFWGAKTINQKGGRVLYFIVDADEKKARRGLSKVINNYAVLNGKVVLGNGSIKKDSKPPVNKKSVVEPVSTEETLTTEGQSIEDFLAGLK